MLLKGVYSPVLELKHNSAIINSEKQHDSSGHVWLWTVSPCVRQTEDFPRSFKFMPTHNVLFSLQFPKPGPGNDPKQLQSQSRGSWEEHLCCWGVWLYCVFESHLPNFIFNTEVVRRVWIHRDSSRSRLLKLRTAEERASFLLSATSLSLQRQQ